MECLLFCWWWVVWVLYIFWMSTTYLTYGLQISFPIWYAAFLFCWWLPYMCRSFYLWCSPICWLLLFCFFYLWSQICITITKTNISEVTAYVSCRNFLVSCLTLKFLIHFEQIFVYGIRVWSSFILLHMAVQLSQCHFLKRVFFLCMLFTSWL